MKRICLFLFLFLLGISCNREPNQPQSNVTKVAALLSLSGPASRFDAIKSQTLEVALERINIAYDSVRINLKIFDVGTTPEGTRSAIRQALVWGARYVLSGTSPTALAISSEIQRRGIKNIVQMANAANPDFGPPRRGEYRLWPDWTHEASLIATLVGQRKYDRVLLIYSSDPYSKALRAALEGQQKQGVKVVYQRLEYDPASTFDFRPPILRANGTGVKAIVVFGLPPGIRSLISQLSDVGWKGDLVGGVNINLTIEDLEKAKLTGSLFSLQTESMKDSLVQGSEAFSFRRLYEVKFNGQKPPFHAVYMADALYFIAAALDADRSTEITEVERIENVRKFAAASGEVEIGPDRVLSYPLHTARIR